VAKKISSRLEKEKDERRISLPQALLEFVLMFLQKLSSFSFKLLMKMKMRR